jgi:hypothetical protein
MCKSYMVGKEASISTSYKTGIEESKGTLY